MKWQETEKHFEDVTFEWTQPWLVLSMTPHILYTEDFLTPAECEHLIQLGTEDEKPSTTGFGKVRIGRSGSVSWIQRSQDLVVSSIYSRVFQSVSMPEIDIAKTAESMQFVSYKTGEDYGPHFDFFTKNVKEYTSHRYITILLYLNAQPHPRAGGNTGFLKAFDNQGIQIPCKQGSAVIFYNLTPEGYFDDKTLHESLPVKEEGWTKYLANIWIWHPCSIKHAMKKSK